MYNLRQISKELIRSDGEIPQEYFVAAAVEVDGLGRAGHVGLIIHCEAGYFLFHFDGGEELELEENPVGWYFHKTLDFILPDFCNSFFGHCDKIKKTAKPKFGHFYSGSYYKEGKYYSENGLEEYMSCVGFCINVVKGFIEADEYFYYQDWTSGSNIQFHQKYIKDFIEKYKKTKPDITEELIAENVRRITPPEYLASAYLVELPIRRAEVRKIHNNVVQAILEKRVKVGQEKDDSSIAKA